MQYCIIHDYDRHYPYLQPPAPATQPPPPLSRPLYTCLLATILPNSVYCTNLMLLDGVWLQHRNSRATDKTGNWKVKSCMELVIKKCNCACYFTVKKGCDELLVFFFFLGDGVVLMGILLIRRHSSMMCTPSLWIHICTYAFMDEKHACIHVYMHTLACRPLLEIWIDDLK